MTITFEIQAKIYRSPVNINKKRVTKSDAKNSDVFERSEFRNFSQMSATLSLFFDMEFS